LGNIGVILGCKCRMTDIFNKAKRSEVMSKVRSSGNKETELKFIQILRKAGISGWRRKQRLLGKPDIIFSKLKVAVFIDGCFWHGCRKCYRRPNSNRIYWDRKVIRNRLRDKKVNSELRKLGWIVLRFWSHQLKRQTFVIRKLNRCLLAE
jgi:DNA mismatch endonuclease (patch repair protein)